MTDDDALKIVDKPDWWMGPDRQGEAMRSLRQALAAVFACQARAFLFRPGGPGDPAVWLNAEDIVRLSTLISQRAGRAA